MKPPVFIFADDVAALLELRNAAAFLRRRARLEREFGFPAPQPWGRPLRWRRSEVLAWRDNLPSLPAADLAAALPSPADAARRAVLRAVARTA